MFVKVKRRKTELAGKLSDHNVGLIPGKVEGEGKRIGKKSLTYRGLSKFCPFQGGNP